MRVWIVNVDVERRYEFIIRADGKAAAQKRAEAFLNGYLPLLDGEEHYEAPPEVSYDIHEAVQYEGET